MQQKNKINCKFSPIEVTNLELDTEKWFLAPSNLILTFAVICRQFILLIQSHFGQEIFSESLSQHIIFSIIDVSFSISSLFCHFIIILPFNHFVLSFVYICKTQIAFSALLCAHNDYKTLIKFTEHVHNISTKAFETLRAPKSLKLRTTNSLRKTHINSRD